MLYKDIEDRLYGETNPNNYNKPMTMTDMKAKCKQFITISAERNRDSQLQHSKRTQLRVEAVRDKLIGNWGDGGL